MQICDRTTGDRFPEQCRNLSWSHHRKVAAFEPAEQDAWLDKAVSNGLSVHALTAEIK